MANSLPLVYGIDGCRAGWLVVSFDGKQANTILVTDLSTIQTTSKNLVFIDMPIGLSSGGAAGRSCDRLARKALSPVRHSSVFTPPCRAAVYAVRKEATAINMQHTGKKLSLQSLNIVPKIRELDTFLQSLTAAEKDRWYEAHPELIFALFNHGKPLTDSKKTAAGRAARLALLAPYFDHLPAWWEKTQNQFLRKHVQLDDIIDALGLAIAAFLYTSKQGELQLFPAEIARDETGLRMQIVAVSPKP